MSNLRLFTLASNLENYTRFKHVKARNYRFIYILTKDMPIDGLTKPLLTTLFRRFVKLVGLTSFIA
ncbi:hypothetical protein N7504_010665 [Penicillium tannophilum]|nr:hypothetical protein N7504_010665 [Penicillium tannophilum]